MWSVLVFLLVSTNGGNTRVLLSCHRLGRHTLPRGTLIREGDLNTNLIKDLCLFVTCFLFDIEANCLTCEEHYCEGLLISMSSYFKYVCHSQCDGTVLHMLCNQAHCLLSNSVTFLYLQKIGKQASEGKRTMFWLCHWRLNPGLETVTGQQSFQWSGDHRLKMINYSCGRTSRLQTDLPLRWPQKVLHW